MPPALSLIRAACFWDIPQLFGAALAGPVPVFSRMALPNAERAHVDPRKVTHYLLSAAHPVGRFKARWFRAIGFTPERTDELVKALQQLAKGGRVRGQVTSEFGTRYIVDGIVKSPSGLSLAIRSIWIVEAGGQRPDFVTAFPRRATPGQER